MKPIEMDIENAGNMYKLSMHDELNQLRMKI